MPVFKFRTKSELLSLGGLNVEECHISAQNRFLLAVLHRNQIKPLSDKSSFILLQEFFRHIPQNLDHLIVSIDRGITFILSMIHTLANYADHPDDSQQMSNMLVGHKDRMHVFPINIGTFQLVAAFILFLFANHLNLYRFL